MKEFINDRFWIIKIGEKQYCVGFTEDYLDRIGTIWSFVPRDSNILVQNRPFANMETAKCLGPLRSPFNGTIIEWGNKILEHPYQITSNDNIFTVEIA